MQDEINEQTTRDGYSWGVPRKVFYDEATEFNYEYEYTVIPDQGCRFRIKIPKELVENETFDHERFLLEECDAACIREPSIAKAGTRGTDEGWEFRDATRRRSSMKQSDYYTVKIEKPASLDGPYSAECLDIIEALGMSFGEGEAFKAIWRMCAARTLGTKKKGYDDTGLYDSRKVVFFGERMVVQAIRETERLGVNFTE